MSDSNSTVAWATPDVLTTACADLQGQLRQAIDCKTKPLGALGRLEGLALQLGLIQQTRQPTLTQPQMVVFAGDHGLTAEGVSAFPQAVTAQMVLNMLGGGAAVNVFARQMSFALRVVDVGVAASFAPHPLLDSQKVAPGTRNSLFEPAMSPDQAQAALAAGARVVRALPGNVVAFGEMGIGNTASATLILAKLADLPLASATGRGTGLNDEQLAHKISVLRKVLARHAAAQSPLEILQAFGGFEIAAITGAMLVAAHERRLILVDGFIASAAALLAHAMAPNVLDYCVFSHTSAEHGHNALLGALGQEPLLQLGLRLGEGTGALLAYPLVQAACNMLCEMATFAQAGVSAKEAPL